MLAAVLRAHPKLQGILFDQPQASFLSYRYLLYHVLLCSATILWLYYPVETRSF